MILATIRLKFMGHDYARCLYDMVQEIEYCYSENDEGGVNLMEEVMSCAQTILGSILH